MALPLLLLAALLARSRSAQIPGAGSADEQDSGYDIVHPVKVDERGVFLSYNLSHRWLHRRAISSKNHPLSFYKLYHGGQELRFNLSLNRHLLAPGFVSERRFGGIAHAEIQAHNQNSCHMVGSVQNQEQENGFAALSTCDGLKGVFRLADEDFFIEPLSASKFREKTAHPHRIYRRHVPEYEAEEFISVVSTKQDRKQPAIVRMCGVQGSLENSEKQREKWEGMRRRKRRIKQRSVSKEKWVETLVVADTKMVEYHGSRDVERYVLTVMNMVAGLFHDASIGNPIHVSIVRLIFLEEEEEDLKITHHADNTLKSFCKWQKSVNVKGDAHPLHHDVAILLTRKDLCAAMNRPCETLGLSHVSGMCQPHRSCNINEDTGLPLAFTVAHELGHSFGIQHDGSGNDCEPVGKRPFIMSPQLLYDTSPLTWSSCSREYVTRFLDRGWGLCLDDPPAKDVIDFPSVPPGVLYDVGHQCRLQYGAYSTYCDDMDSICNTLWCSVGNTCHSKLDAAVDGTKCDESKWCFNGECVHMGYRPESISGVWAAWSSWGACSRTCGAGVQNAERQCNSPTPKYGGKYCLGERKRFRICNTKSCPTDRPSYRHIQCSRFDTKPYKGTLYKWTPVPNNINPCELHCRPENEYFAEKLRDAVIDGTPCYEAKSSRDVCINGICKNVGCDYEIDSYAVEDRCGVCHGDGSTCETVKRTFEESDGLGYVDVGLIPAGAREIQIEEVAEAENFLALRSENPDKYFLNGGWTIQWNGDYKVAGTTFTYERTGNWENLTSPGPTEEPVWIQLLFQEKNPGIRYQYTIQRESDSENEIAPAEFFWQYGPWTKCTATCGTGVQRQIVHCVEKVAGIVEERYCNVLSRPDDQQRSCSEEPCPARWWAGEWQVCSATCGDTGLMKRTILCIQSVALDEQRALLPGKCQHLLKPDAMAPCNREVLCPAQWAIGNWSECSVTCGSGTQQRPVYCPNDTRASCAPGQKPASEIVCSLPLCWNRVESIVSDWSGSGSSSQELFNEINFIPHHHIPRFSPSTPESKDLNAIMEDFSPSNNKKGNVFVDDFYYDYNFINFHEDLSYDPVDEKGSMGEDLKPDLGRKMVTSMKGDSNEMLPDFLPIVKPESRMDKKSTKSPDIGGNNEEETDGVHKHTTVANLHSPVGTTMVPWATSPTAVSGKGTPPPLWGDHPSTSAAARHFPDASENTVLRGNVAAATTPASFSYWTVPTPMSPPGKGSSNQGSEPGAPEGRMQEAESSQVPYHSASEPNRWLGVVQKGDGEERGAGRAVIDLEDDRGAARRTKEAPVGTVSATAAATARGPPDHFIHQRSRSTETTPNLPTQDTSENSKDPGDVMDSHNMANGKSHAADAQNHRHYPVVEGEDALPPTIDLPPVAPTLTLAYTFSGHGSQALASHNPNSSGLQLPTEPTFGGQSPAAPNSFPSVSPAPSQKESMGINLGAKDTPSSGDKGLFRNQSSSNGVHWMFASGSGGLQPSLAPVKHQEEGKDGTPSVVPSAAVVAAPNASWEAGNWSECSTTCGLGAIWRTVRCSTGQEEDCSPARKPIPARRCYLRPCSTWRVGNWSKCSRTCGGGVKVRDIHCVDTRDQRPLRPFHCQATPYKPPTQMPCQSQPCLGWYTSAWRECSELCGGGEQQRLVTCPEFGRCDEALRPNNTRPCNVHPCTKWTVGSWGQCTATCGGGIQRRQVKCVNTKTGEAEEDNSLCDHEQWPENTQKCNPQDCSHSQPRTVAL
ncbi:A disintegrin and metalloproteinase with thrombospondin motifs 7 isoform X2 [Rhineura floridana]|uniref:A disintegrin and metalloproteinase with thrombospondin motifs 7 isoform X2 n=1 Tax=Rhineura floridana TaxID=261503 RepID=UPI002AC7E819|nr:A disintegrin and metalloproteinase with thrombospondin motifs 7 isoform X2 [Rhineura floridana]